MADNDASGETAPLADQAKQQAQQVVQQGQQAAGRLWDVARGQFRAQLTGQKDRGAARLMDWAQALRQAGSHLREQGQPGGADIAARFGDRVAVLSEAIQQKELEELVADVEGFGRSRPALFLAIAVTLGFLSARFLKSTTPSAA